MDNLDQIITDYLIAENTDYAIMINGDWGCGKTYYTTQVLFAKVGQIQCPMSEKRCEPLYVSLYGLSNAENINTKVLLEIYPWLKKKWLLGVGAVANRGLNMIPFLSGGISNEEKKAIASYFSISKNKVLFFDDLERVSQQLGIREVLGCLNAYAEQQKLKVIIICNDRNVPDEYKEFKEKTIRFTYNYETQIDTVYDNIAQNFKTEKYKEFLVANKNTVLQIFREEEYKNLRTLRFILEVFQKIFDQTSVVDFQERVLKQLFFFTVIYSIEYKKEHSKEELDTLAKAENYFDISAFLTDKKDEKQPEYYEQFAKKYTNIIEQFFYYQEIADYICFGYLDVDKFKKMIQTIVEKIQQHEGNPTLKKLDNWEQIADDDFGPIINEVLTGVRDNAYNLYIYPKIYATLIQIEYFQIENFTITADIKKSFKAAIDNSKSSHKFNYYFNSLLPQWSSTDKSNCKDKYQEIYNYAMQANEDVGKKENEEKANLFLDMIAQNKNEDLQRYMFDNRSKPDRLKQVDANKVFEKLILSNATTINAFVQGIYAFFPHTSYEDEERTFLQIMQTKIDTYLNTLEKRPPKVAKLIYLRNKIEDILK